MYTFFKFFQLTFIRKQFLYHCLGWILFITYEVSFVQLILGSPLQYSLLGDYVLPYLLNIVLFYVNAHVLLTYCYASNYRPRYISLVLLSLAEAAMYLTLMNAINQRFTANPVNFFHFQSSLSRLALLKQLWRGLYFLGISAAYWFTLRSFHNEKKVMELEMINLQAEKEKHVMEKNLMATQNAYLKSQVNPHLLFNTLNFIYSDIYLQSPKASQAVELLSELMNYSLYSEEKDGKVPLEQEVTQINHLIQINQLRFENQLQIQPHFEGNFTEARIYPLLLIPLLENLFKYGYLVDPSAPARIALLLHGQTLKFCTENKKRNHPNVSSHHIGLANVKKRLELYYPGNHTLSVYTCEDIFSLNLTINLTA